MISHRWAPTVVVGALFAWIAYTTSGIRGDLREILRPPEHRLRITETPTLNTTTMGKTTLYKYDDEGNIILSHTFCQGATETFAAYRARVKEEWKALCEDFG